MEEWGLLYRSQAPAVIRSSEHFSPDEFPTDALEYMDTGFALGLVAWRKLLGEPVAPSPRPGAWFRMDGRRTSRHYAVGRWSDAGDVFPLGCPVKAFLFALKQFTGIGVYLDTHYKGKPRVMLHLDTRPGAPVFWVRDGEYYGLNTAPEAFRVRMSRFFGMAEKENGNHE